MAPAPAFDLYEALELTQTATSEEIRQSYRRLALLHHPDKNPDDATAKDRFQRIGLAYEHLSDDTKRNLYDNRSIHPNPAQQFSSGSGRAYYYDFDFEFDSDDAYYHVGFDLDEFMARFARREADWKRQQAAWDAQVDGDRARAREEYLAREKAERERREARVRAKREEEEQLGKRKEDREKAERVQQEKRWSSLNATTEEEMQKTCYHSEFWPKEHQKKKFKCGECSQKRGMAGYRCPHCSLLVCQICVSKLRDPKVNEERKLNAERDHEDDHSTEGKAPGTGDSQAIPEAHEEYQAFKKASPKSASSPKNPFAVLGSDEDDEEPIFRGRSTPSTTTDKPPETAPSSVKSATKTSRASKKSKVESAMRNAEQQQSGKGKVAQTADLGNGNGEGNGNEALTSKTKRGEGNAANSAQCVTGNDLATCPIFNEQMTEGAVDDHIDMCNSTAQSTNVMNHPTSEAANSGQNQNEATPSSPTTSESNIKDTSQPRSSLPAEQPKAETNGPEVKTPVAEANTSKARVSEDMEAASEEATKACKLPIKTRSDGPARAFIKFTDPKKSITLSHLTQIMEGFGDVTEIKYIEKPFGRAKKMKIHAEVLFTKPDGLKRAISASPKPVAQGSICIMKMKQSKDREWKPAVPETTVLKRSLEELQTELEVEKVKLSSLQLQSTLQHDKAAKAEEELAEQKQKFSELEVWFNVDRENLVEAQDALRSKHTLIKELESERKELLPAKARVDELEKELEELMGNLSTMKAQSEEGWEKLLKAETDLSSKQARVDKHWEMLCEAQTEMARRQAIISEQAEKIEKAEKDLAEKQGIIDDLKRERDALLHAQNKSLTSHQAQGTVSVHKPAIFEAKPPGPTKGYVKISFDPSRTLTLKLLRQVMEGFGAVIDAALISPGSAFVNFARPWGLKNAMDAGNFFIGEATVRVTQFRDTKPVADENKLQDLTGSSQFTSIHDRGKNDENGQSSNHATRSECVGRSGFMSLGYNPKNSQTVQVASISISSSIGRGQPPFPPQHQAQVSKHGGSGGRTDRGGRDSFISLNRDTHNSQAAEIVSPFGSNKDENKSSYREYQDQAPKRGGQYFGRGGRNSFVSQDHIHDSQPSEIATQFIGLKKEENQALYPSQYQSQAPKREGRNSFASLKNRDTRISQSANIATNKDENQSPYPPPYQRQAPTRGGQFVGRGNRSSFAAPRDYAQNFQTTEMAYPSPGPNKDENQSPYFSQGQAPKRGEQCGRQEGRNSLPPLRDYAHDSQPAKISTPFVVADNDKKQSLYPPRYQATWRGGQDGGTNRGDSDGFASLDANQQNPQLADSLSKRLDKNNYQHPYSPPHQTQNQGGRGEHISRAGTGNFTSLENYLQDSQPATISTPFNATNNENQSPNRPQHEAPKRGGRYVGRGGNRGFRDRRSGGGYGNRGENFRDEGVI